MRCPWLSCSFLSRIVSITAARLGEFPQDLIQDSNFGVSFRPKTNPTRFPPGELDSLECNTKSLTVQIGTTETGR